MTTLSIVALLAWLFLAGSGFWLCRERDTRVACSPPDYWPDIVAVVPARNEADVIARSLGSLAAQDYPGNFRVLLVDDDSTDGTGDIARTLVSPRLTVIRGAPLALGWTGKLWALSQGIANAGKPEWLWLTDADIEHKPDTLRRLVCIANSGDRKLVSFMAWLHCETWPERMLVPAFIYFFMMLYPFNWINRTGPLAGAAGGCVLVHAHTLERAGGISAIRGALIDDCALGRLIKQHGPIWLGLTRRSLSIRPYRTLNEIAAMVSRSAYAQLRYSLPILLATIAGLALVFIIGPALALFATGTAQICGLGTWALMTVSYQPIMRFYHRSPLWGLALPLVASAYAWCTVLSAWQHHRGRGGMWKGRAQALAGR